MRLSRKNIFTTVLGFIFLCFVSSCSFVEDVVLTVLTGLSIDVWDGETVSKVYNGSTVQYEIPKNVRTVALTATEAVDVFMVKMNMGTTAIPATSTRYIVSATSEGQGLGGFYSIRSAEEENLSLEIADLENVSGITPSGFIRKDFIPARDFKPPFRDKVSSGRFARTASVASEPMKSTTSGEREYVVGDEKKIWVDIPLTKGKENVIESASNGQYTKRNATLQAKMENCYIWVLDENYSDSGASGAKITQEKAEILADKFNSIYEPIQEVFGYESDTMIDCDDFAEMSAVSDTGTKVNIVVYDIEGDYIKEQDSGTAGYFWAKDYYTPDSKDFYNDDILSLSNNGKYFYVDSGFLNDYPEMIYSTLAHEFQHMINFGEKTMESMQNAESEVLYSDTWSNEMMSMVCEDMVQDLLDIPDIRSPLGRLLYFTEGYYRSGLTDWLTGNNVNYSYAGAYAFGAYLARNYGGMALIAEIATNDFVDQEAITQALKANKKTSSETFGTVFKKFPLALVLDNPPTGVTVPSFNKSVNGIGGMMPAIDIFNMVVSDGDGKQYSIKPPTLLPTKSSSRVDLRPYGFTLHSVVSTNSAGTVNITFSSPVNDNEKIYLLVQPKN